MKNPIYLLIAIFSSFYLFSQNSKVNVSERPTWVRYQQYQEFPLVNQDELVQGIINLLVDYQVHVPKQEQYFRMVTKITDNVGIQPSSTISAVFDPLYQKLTFHSISIIRDGKIINKLNPNDFQVLRREVNAENYLYDGSLSAVLNMSDVRTGDIIDYSYSIKGFNPIHKGKYSGSFALNDYIPIGKINVSINSSSKLYYKTYNTNLLPEITKQDGVTSYNWTVNTPKHTVYEENMPIGKIIMPSVIVTNYESWEDVVNWGVSVFKTNERLTTSLVEEIEKIKKNNPTEGKRIKAILNFVQDEIRYLGLEHGISSYKPNSPNKVFEQRFGDCKDKSLLMVHMLNQIGVEAYPMFVNSVFKEEITKIPAAPDFFDHCVVKVIGKDKWELYYDPTLENQGGTFKKVHFPNYRIGLVLKENNKTLDTIYSSSTNSIVKYEEFIIKEENAGAILNVTTTYTDAEADAMRSFFKKNSKSNIIKEYEKYYSNFYPKVKITKEPTVIDNIQKNEFIVSESYTLNSIWKPMNQKPGFISLEFYPSTLNDILYATNLENRTHEINLPYPVLREHITTVHLPRNWNIQESRDIISNESFYYEFDVKYDKKTNRLQLRNFLKTQQSIIPKEQLKKYAEDIKSLNENYGYSLFTPLDKNNVESEFSNFDFTIILVLIIFCLIGFIIFRSLRKK